MKTHEGDKCSDTAADRRWRPTGLSHGNEEEEEEEEAADLSGGV